MTIKIDAVSVGILFIIFILLKSMGLITLSWFWVLSPLWIFALLILLCVVIISIFTLFRILIDLIKYKKIYKNPKLYKGKNNAKK